MPRGVVLLLVLLFCVPAPAAAAEPAHIAVRVTVVDSLTKRPVPHAHVRLLSDARQYDGFSGADGVVDFTAVVAANYGVRVDADGYSFARDADVTATGSASQSLTVTGVRTKLSRIGTVVARSSPAPNLARGTRDTDPSAIIAGGVGGALDTITAIGRSPDGSPLIHNHDASTTATTFNGAPIFPSGTKNQLGLLGGDIFSSAALGTSAVAGAPNGTLDLHTYDPTVDWIGVIQARGASFGGSAETLQERGTAGRVGFSFVHAQEERGAPLDGRYYADTTGVASIHHANPLSSADTFTTRYGFDANHVALLDVATLRAETPLICTEQTGPLPCGYGSGNRTVQRGAFAQLRDSLTFDRATLDLNLFQSRSEILEQFANRVSAGTPAGFDNSSTTDRRGYLAALGVLYAGQRIAHLRVSGYADVTRNGGSFVSSAFPPPVAASAQSLALDLPVIASRKFSLLAGAGHDTSSGVSHGTFNVNGSYQITNRDALTASFATGHLGSRQAAFDGVDLPSDLTFDCGGAAAIGAGPLVSPGQVAATTQTRVGVHHTGARVSLGLDAFRDVDRNASVNAVVPATALSGSLFASTYFGAASQAGASACGRAFPVTADSLFYRISSPVARTVNDGFDSSAQFEIGRALRLDLAYSLLRARAFGSGFPFVPGSNLVAGSQIPLLPLHNEKATLTYALSRSTTLMGVAQFQGSDNAYRARPFTRIDLGARFASFGGDLAVGVQNLTNVDAGPFARFDPFPTFATPLTPRAYSVRYRIAVGKQGIDNAARLSPPFGQGGFMFMVRDFETVARTDWLAPDTQSPVCGAEQLPQARVYEEAIRAYDARVQEALRADPQLKTFPDETFDALTLSFVPNAGSYAIRLRLRFQQGRKISPFTRCTRIHAGTYDEAVRLHLYAPSWQEREARGFDLYYSPQAGVYFAPQGVNATSPVDHEEPMGLPAHAPADPFAIDEASCPATYRPAVRDALRALRNSITAAYAGGRLSAPDGFAISKHAAKSEPWLELRADDAPFGEAILTCVNAPNVTSAELAKRGLSGANIPSFSYAPSVGFYRVIPVFESTKK